MKLEYLLNGYPAMCVYGDLPLRITGFTANSKKTEPGYLYICVRGEKQDGHRFATEAVRNGALAVVAEKPLSVPVPVICVPETRHFLSFFSDRFYGSPSLKMHITGITGTNGKTTTAHFLYNIYRTAGIRGALMGTAGIKAGDITLKQTLTTPGAEELHKILWQLARHNITHVAAEVSSHALVQRRVEHCRFGTAIYTNLTREHLDYHGTMERYYQAKAHLFQLLRQSPRGCAVINTDDRWGRHLYQSLNGYRASFGRREEAEYRIEELLPLTVRGTFVRMRTPNGLITFVVSLPGHYNVLNAVAAGVSALTQGIDPDFVTRGIESLQQVPGRLEQLAVPSGVKVFLDYAHTPDGLEKVLQATTEMPHRKMILVFGCRGDRDRGKRPLMGKIAASYADSVILTADNPAGEDPALIAEEIARNMPSSPLFIPDREEAIHKALDAAGTGDIVLITGKGHENYQLVGETVKPYSDSRAVARYYER
jgi:UDP-N-acetylmuramoyl-L-alanyl-D-glutamate--2,6-diaminopimelate ligase